MVAFNSSKIKDIPDHYRLISRTDTHGTILEANSEFIEISGYTSEELMGQPHNILRCPDVPKLVFKDLWETIQTGHDWTQIVKNNTKDGRSYWVKANVSPVLHDGKITGFISIRKPATLEQAMEAEDAYKKINRGELVIKGGHIYTPGAYKRFTMNPYNKLGLIGKLVSIGVVILLATLIISGSLVEVDYVKQKKANTLALHDTLKTHLEEEIHAIGHESRNTAIGIAGTKRLSQLIEAGDHDGARELLLSQVSNYNKLTGESILAHIHSGKGISIARSWTEEANDDLTGFRHSINDIIKNHKPSQVLELDHHGLAIHSLAPVFSSDKKYIGSVEIITPLSALDVSLNGINAQYVALLTKTATKIATATQNNRKIGDYTLASETEFKTEAVNKLAQININTLINKGHLETATDYFAVEPILDTRKQQIGYHVIIEPITELSALNSVSAQDAIHNILMVVVSVLLVIFAYILLVYINIIKPFRTMQDLIKQASKQGDLSLRLDDRSKDEMGQVARAYNSQMQNMQVIMGEMGRMVKSISEGNFKTSTIIETEGDFSVITTNISNALTSINATFSELRNVLNHINRGDFSYSASINMSGDFKLALNDALASMATLRGVFHEVNQLMTQVANGFFTRRIEAEAKGELHTLKQNINNSLDQLQSAIEETTQVMIAQGAGDLTRRIESPFDGTLAILKSGINNSVTNTGSLISQSNYSLLKLAEGAKQIALDVADLSSRTQEQAASLEETAASMEQITSTIKTTADNAAQADIVAEESIQEANQANQVVHKTIRAINEISEASSRISDITSLIDSIAFQTNLLALNAAVEAARAGDHGRGFAVVAGEVRSLAGKSAEAAKDIRSLIDNTLTKVQEGATLAQESGEALNVINDSINKISTFVKEISQTSREQAKGVEQVNVAITQIDQVTQQNSALVEKTAEHTADMGRLAEEVINVSKTFKIDLNQIDFSNAMQTGNFTFANARRAHRQWAGIIHAFVEGMQVDFNKEAATDHTKCGLGLWFYGPVGQKFATLPEMKEVEKWHIEIHTIIKHILEANERKDDALMSTLFTKLDETSAKVIQHLSAAELAVTSGAAKSSHRLVASHNTTEQKAPASSRPAAAPAKAVAHSAAPKPTSSGLQTPPPAQKKQTHNDDEWGEF